MTERSRVLVVGAGRRVQNNFLPALRCLEASFDIVGVHSRTAETRDPVSGQWGVPSIARIADVDLGRVDVVAISVPTAQNGAVLRQLLDHAGRIVIVIDTPVAWTASELADLKPLLKRFRRVFITEDYMNFPPFVLARSAVAAGLIGRVERLVLAHIGYLYHGLALLRSFVDFAPVLGASFDRARDKVTYRLPRGIRAEVIGPYQRDGGSFTIVGANGILTDSADETAPPGRATYRIVPLLDEGGQPAAFRIVDAATGLDAGPSLDTPFIPRMAAMAFDDKSSGNLLRGAGLARIFEAIRVSDGLNERYGAPNAFYDSVVSRLAGKGRLPLDPFRWLGLDVMTPYVMACRIKALLRR